ncbi:50S ribosomal protein L10 [Candidatus Saccharibacteria bacterium RIFCSPHIGHO2_12_FULL_41_12]|nr:MAG: 50S ribosomal protein L10 [Candidatus Saccharibacteria bacterium RIFCSPHIGHO2_12_FULL_41_12]
MALTKVKKKEIIDEVTKLLEESKLTVIAKYEGTPVKAMQELRRTGKESQTSLKVIKNRLVIKAITSSNKLKDINVDDLTGMLLYGFNPVDEVAPAKVIADFAKKQKTLVFVGAISEDGKLMTADEVKALASLPGKNELIAQILHTLNSPLNNSMSGLRGDLHGMLKGLEKAKAN